MQYAPFRYHRGVAAAPSQEFGRVNAGLVVDEPGGPPSVAPQAELAFYGIPTIDDTPPRVVEAKSISATSVLVTFSEPLDSEAGDPSHFAIGPNLVVTGAVQAEYQTQVLLSTTRQVADTLYTVTVSDVRDRARNTIDPAANSADFRGISRELFLSSATALSATSVQLVWSEPMDPSTTENVANYDIADPDADSDLDIHITGATASADGRTVVLDTTPQSNTVYEITATDIRAIRDDFYIDPNRSKALFHGIPPQDTTPPQVVSAASATDSTYWSRLASHSRSNRPTRRTSAFRGSRSSTPSSRPRKTKSC